MKVRFVLAALTLIFVFASSSTAYAQYAGATGEKANEQAALENVGVDEHLDGPVPLDPIFKDEHGKVVRFGDYVDGKKPVVLVLAYHSCKTLCSFVQNAVLDSLKGVPWTVGQEFEVVTLSIDSRDTVAIANGKKTETMASYAREGASNGWHFLTGDDQNVHRITDAVGWKFHKDIDGEIAHPAAIMILKPNGHVARYLYGIEYPSNDMSLGLLEASEGHNITTIERIKLFCYHYDPHQRKYALLATHVMEVGGGITLLLVVGLIGGMVLRERRNKKTQAVPVTT